MHPLNILRLAVLILILTGITAWTPTARADADNPEYIYRGDNMRLVCYDETPTDSGHDINGMLELNGNRFPFTGKVTRGSNKAAGTFEAGGAKYDFTAVPDEGDQSRLIFKTGNTTKTLTLVEPEREAEPNPFDQKKADNPFEKESGSVEDAAEDVGGGGGGGGKSTRAWSGTVGDADYKQLEKAVQAYDDGDRDAAYAIYKPLAAKGHLGAAFMMGIAYEFEYTVERDDAKAAEWYRKALGAEHAGALYNLSMLTAKGNGVEQDADEAHALMRRSAVRGNASAMNDYAAPIVTGERKDEPYELGIAWMMLAADEGYEMAQNNMDILRKQATPAQLAKAKTIMNDQLKPEVDQMRANNHFVLGYHQYQVTQ